MISGMRDPKVREDLERILKADPSTLSGRERQRRAAHEAKRTHGMCHTSEYRIWQQMWNRCTNPKYHSFHRYGGRGITVCSRWETFEAFYEDMGPKPAPGHTLERKDNDGPYSKDNCRWATRFEQGQNTSKTTDWVVLNGERLTFAVASRRLGLKSWTLANRVHRDGWTLEQAIATPLGGRR